MPIWTEQYFDVVHKGRHGAWVIPTSCPCCNKCWLITNEKGEVKIFIDNLGRGSPRCINHGPYKGYIEI